MTVRAPSSPPFAALVGRAAEISELSRRFDEGARLVTLVGPPGMGKTRLARALARGWSEQGLAPAWIDLPGGSRSDEVCARVADVLGLRLSWMEPTDPITEVGWALEGRGDTRLILDEAEGCLDALVDVLARWLDTAPDARALVTSQERLGLPGEVVVEVGPLPLEEAEQLLRERAGRPDETNEALRELAARLEGIPLAIELVAARLSLLEPEEALARLDDGLVLIDTKRSGRTLRGAIAASWERLDEHERRALSCCAIFEAPFRVDAAEAVIGAAHGAAIESLQGLRDKSLLTRTGGRCRLYAPVRAFASEHFLDDAGPARERFVGFYAGLVTRELRLLDGPGAEKALRRLIDEVDHLRTALQQSDGAATDALARGVAEVALTRGPTADALQVIDGMPNTEAIRGRALETLGRTDEAVDAYRRAGPSAATLLAHAELARGRVDDAAAAIDGAVKATERQTLAGVASLRMRGVIHHARGELEDALQDYEAARVIAEELGSQRRAAQLRADVGAVRLQQGRLDEAREAYREAIEGLDEQTDPLTLGLAEGNLAILEQEIGDLEEAAALHVRAFDRVRRVGHRLYAAHLGGYAGAVEHERGDLRAALARYEPSLDGLRRVGDARLVAVIGALRGSAEAGCDRIEAAAEAFAEVDRALESVHDRGIEQAARVHRHHLALARGRAGLIPEEEARTEARAVCAEVEESGALQPSDDLRLALRLLRAALGHGSLRVDGETRRVSLPDGSVVDLSRRGVLWRLVEALAGARREHPPRPLTVHELLEAGWPGEAPTGASGLNRVKVALSTLRKLGLREVLQREGGGYVFALDVPFG